MLEAEQLLPQDTKMTATCENKIAGLYQSHRVFFLVVWIYARDTSLRDASRVLPVSMTFHSLSLGTDVEGIQP